MRVDSQRRAPSRVLRVLSHPPHRKALVVAAIALVMGSLFVVSYSLALARPTPHHIRTALVGTPSADEQALIASIERDAGSWLELDSYPSEGAALRAIASERVYAAIVTTRRRLRFLLASAAGASVARVLTEAVAKASAGQATAIQVVDLKPLPKSDPQGLETFYVTLAATILGFVAIFQLRANAHGLSLRAWLGFVAGFALVVGLLLALIVGPGLGSLRGPFAEIWGILTLEDAAAALFASTMIVLAGRAAIIPTWLLFVVLGNTSSGGAVSPPLLPPFYAFIGRFLSPGAAVAALRGAVYFRGHQHLEPILVLVCWVVGSLAALLVATRVRGRTPALPAG